jgi:hypothetical protein
MATYTDGYGGDTNTAQDTTIYSSEPTRSQGAWTALDVSFSGAGKALLRFDLSAIPTGSTCTAATLYLYHYSVGGASAWTINAYSVAQANAAWIEGGSNNPAAAGEPCWNALAADGSGGVTTAWAGAAGCSTSGTDYEATSLGSVSGNREDAAGTEYQLAFNAAGLARLEGWFGTPNTNYGLVLIADFNVSYFCSSDHATTGYRPKLVVEYTEAGGGGIVRQMMAHHEG